MISFNLHRLTLWSLEKIPTHHCLVDGRWQFFLGGGKAQVTTMAMRDVSQGQAHMLLLDRFKLVGEDVEFAAYNDYRNRQRLNLGTVFVFFPDLPDPLLFQLILLMLSRCQLLLDVKHSFTQMFSDGCQPE